MLIKQDDFRKTARWPVLALIFAGYVIVAKLSFLVTIPPGNISPIFPAAGIALAAVLLCGGRALPVVWLASFTVNLSGFFKGSDDLVAISKAVAAAAVIGVGASLGAWFGARLVRRMSHGGDLLEGGGQVLRLLFFGAVVGCLFSPSFGVSGLCLAGIVPVSQFGLTWITWWVGDTVGCLIMAPCLLAWSMPAGESVARGRAAEAALLAVATGLVCYTAFFRHQEVEYISLVVLTWAAFRFGIRGVSLLGLIIAGAATVGTCMGLSAFTFESGVADSLIMLHSFLGTAVVSALVLAGVLTEHRRAVSELSTRRERLEDEVERRTRELTLLNRLVYDSLEAASVGTWWIDLTEKETFHGLDSTGRILAISPRDGEDKVYDLGAWRRVTNETKVRFPEHADTICRAEAHFIAVVEGRAEAYHAVYPMVMPDGALKWIDARAHVSSRDSNGRALTMTGTLIDITPLKLAELELEDHRDRLESLVARRTAALSASEERFQLAVDAAGIGIWDWDIVHEELIWDDCIYRQYGVRREDFPVAFEAWEKCLHPEDARMAKDAVEAALRGEKEYFVEFRVIRPDGEVRHTQSAAKTYRDEAGNAVRMIGTNIDITTSKRGEEKLRQNEKRFRSFFDLVPIPLANYTADGSISYLNEAFVKTLGYTDTELRNLDEWWILAYPDSEYRQWVKDTWDESVARSVATRAPLVPQEYSVTCKDGSVKPLLIGGVNIGEEFLATFLDLSDRKRAEMRDLHIRLILENVAAGQALHDTLDFVCRCVEKDIPGSIASILLIDDDGVRFRFGAAPSLPDFYNQAEDGMHFAYGVGSCGSAVVSAKTSVAEDITTHPHWAPFREIAARAGVRACWSIPIASASGKTLASFAIYHREPFSPTDADTKDVQLFIESIRITIESDLARREIRDHREHLEELVAMRTAELSKSRNKLETAMAQAHMANWEFDFETDCFVFDDHFYALYGTTAEREGGVRLSGEYFFREFFHPDDLERIVSARDAVFASKDPVIFHAMEHRIIRRDGEVRVIAAHFRLVRDESGKPVEWVGCHQDITEQKRLEADLIRAKDAAESANLAKSAFLANMSHEIRTPMNGVLGMAELLSRTPLEAGQREQLAMLRSSGEDLLKIINDILDFSKIEAGRMELETIGFSLHDLASRTLQALASQAAAKKLEIELDIPDDMPDLRLGDPNRLRQVLTNMVGNAIKFTERGWVRVVITQGQGPHDLRVEVTDTGKGISSEVRAKLFQPFSQADASTTRKHGGTGLGLVISARIIEQMGGRTGVISELGRGSTFWFELSLPPATPEQVSDPDNRIPDALPLLAGKRVLLVDDNAVNRAVAGTLMRRWGMKVSEAEDGPAALAQVRAVARVDDAGYDLAVLDGAMPGMDGWQLAAAIREISGCSTLPLVMASSFGLESTHDSSGESSMFRRFLLKPLRPAQLAGALAEALSDWHPVQIAPTPKAAPGARVLLVEDTKVNQMVARAMLEKGGHQVTLSENGVEALAQLEQPGLFDIILMDCQMPVMDGFEATRQLRLREQERDWPRYRVVAMTANAMQSDKEACLDAGMDGYLSKPVKMDQLLEVVAGG